MGKMFDVDEIRKALEANTLLNHTSLQPCEVIQKAMGYLMHGVKWNDYPDDYYHVWYYAEGEIYVIRDVMVDTFAFIEAKSPEEAYEKYMKRWYEAMKAGELEEDEWED